MISYRLNLLLFIGVTCLGFAPISMARSLESAIGISHSHEIVSEISRASQLPRKVGSVTPLLVSLRQRVNTHSLGMTENLQPSPTLTTSNGQMTDDFSGMIQTAANEGKSKKKLFWMVLIGCSTLFGAGIFAGLFYMLTNSSFEIEESESELVEDLNAEHTAGGDAPEFPVEQNSQNGLAPDSVAIATELPPTNQTLESEQTTTSQVPQNLAESSENSTKEPQPNHAVESVATPTPISPSNSQETQTNKQISLPSTQDLAVQLQTDKREGAQNWKASETTTPLSQETPESLSQKESQSLAIEQTSRLAKIDLIEELIKDLQSSDPTKRRKSIWELGQRGDSRAVQPLVDLIVDSDSKQVSLILGALSEIGTRTLKPMNRALALSLQDRNPDVRKNAIRDLTRIYDLVSQIGQLLRHAVDDSDVEVQETARWALNQLSQINTMSSYQSRSTLHNWTNPMDNSSEDLSL